MAGPAPAASPQHVTAAVTTLNTKIGKRLTHTPEFSPKNPRNEPTVSLTQPVITTQDTFG
jgi:hypothetical protein